MASLAGYRKDLNDTPIKNKVEEMSINMHRGCEYALFEIYVRENLSELFRYPVSDIIRILQDDITRGI